MIESWVEGHLDAVGIGVVAIGVVDEVGDGAVVVPVEGEIAELVLGEIEDSEEGIISGFDQVRGTFDSCGFGLIHFLSICSCGNGEQHQDGTHESRDHGVMIASTNFERGLSG